VRKIQINIVGSISEKEELKEIENVANVFVVAERLIDLTCDLKSEFIDSGTPQNSPKKIYSNQNSYNIHQSLITIHGFN